MGKKIKIFGGTASSKLAVDICDFLQIPPGKIEIKKFADGEIGVKLLEPVRGSEVFIIQSSCTPVNDNLMELFLIVDAAKRASAKRITAVIPYFGYARQDRKTQPRVPISAALVAQLITASGVDRVLSVDLHCGQIQGFFKNSIAVDNLNAQPILAAATKEFFDDINIGNLCIVSPDAGGAERADRFRAIMAQLFQHSIEKHQKNGEKCVINMALMNKKREEANKVSKMELVGDVTDSDCIIVDDLIDTAGTLVFAAETLKKNGAKRVFAVATHGLFNSPAIEKIEQSPIEKIIVTNTVSLEKVKEKSTKLIPISIAQLISEAIRRIFNQESLSSVFANINF